MKNETNCLVLIPYFGKLPRFFPFWATSAGMVKSLEWLLLGDNEPMCHLPQNVKFKKVSFNSIQNRIRARFPFSIKLDTPWDLCAFKPAYGDIFEDEFRQYDFWGYGDLDVIYGNLDKYLNDDLFSKYDKIFRWGHLSLIRNTKLCRSVYSKQLEDSNLNFQDAFNGRVACFDERMFNELFEVYAGKIYNSMPLADFVQRSHLMRFHLPTERTPQDAYKIADVSNPRNIFTWNSQGLLRYYVDSNGEVKNEEFSYIHFCRRRMDLGCEADIDKGFCMVPNRIIKMPRVIDARFIMRNTKTKIYWSYILPRLAPKRLCSRLFGRKKNIPEK